MQNFEGSCITQGDKTNLKSSFKRSQARLQLLCLALQLGGGPGGNQSMNECDLNTLCYSVVEHEKKSFCKMTDFSLLSSFNLVLQGLVLPLQVRRPQGDLVLLQPLGLPAPSSCLFVL